MITAVTLVWKDIWIQYCFQIFRENLLVILGHLVLVDGAHQLFPFIRMEIQSRSMSWKINASLLWMRKLQSLENRSQL